MMYGQTLKDLRRDLETPVVEQPAPSGGLIPQRGNTAPAATDDPLSFVRDWMTSIKASGDASRKRWEAETEQMLKRRSPSVSNKTTPTKIEADVPVVEDPPRESIFNGEEVEPSRTRREGNVDFDFTLDGSGGMTSLMELMDRHEGGGNYSTLFGHSQRNRFSGTDVSKMTLAEVKEFSNPKGSYANWVKSQVGRVATPMGRYQFVGSTLRQVQKDMGLSDDTVFDARTQDAMFQYYLQSRLARADTISGKVDQLRQAWEGFKHVPTTRLASIVRNLSNDS